MGVIQLPDELQRVIEQQVTEGRAPSPAAFLEKAVMRLVDESRAEEADILATAEAGDADIAAGRCTTVADAEDAERLHERMMGRLHTRLTSSD